MAAYRCNKCRSRNLFAKVTNWTPTRGLPRMSRKEVDRILRAIGGKRCKNCGHTSFYLDKERANRVACHCPAYHFPHRWGYACCENNPNSNVFRAYREGLDEEDIAWHGLRPSAPLPGNSCPF